MECSPLQPLSPHFPTRCLYLIHLLRVFFAAYFERACQWNMPKTHRKILQAQKRRSRGRGGCDLQGNCTLSVANFFCVFGAKNANGALPANGSNWLSGPLSAFHSIPRIFSSFLRETKKKKKEKQHNSTRSTTKINRYHLVTLELCVVLPLSVCASS